MQDGGSKFCFLVELVDNSGEVHHYKTKDKSRTSITHKTKDGEDVLDVKVWSIRDDLKSEEFLSARVAPAPRIMRDYVHHLRAELKREPRLARELNDYMFKVSESNPSREYAVFISV